MIQMISSGNILKDYEDFLKVLMEKYNIQDRESFEKDFFDFLSKVVKPEYKNLKLQGLLQKIQMKYQKFQKNFLP